METLTIDIDQRLIDEHGEDVDRSEDCPCYVWLKEHGLDPTYVTYGFAALDDGRRVVFPEEFVGWQRIGVSAKYRDGVEDPRPALKPITFDARLEDDL